MTRHRANKVISPTRSRFRGGHHRRENAPLDAVAERGKGAVAPKVFENTICESQKNFYILEKGGRKNAFPRRFIRRNK